MQPRKRKTAAVLATIATALLLALGMVTPSFATLTGSTFNGSNGQLDSNSGPALPDFPSGQGDNSFVGGTSENDVNVKLDTGSIPGNKSDLTNFWTSIETGTNGHLFLYLAWERASTSGTVDVDFELNRVAQTIPSPPYKNTPMTLQRTAAVYNTDGSLKAAGDLLVTYDFSGNNNVPVLGLYMWNGTSWATAGVIAGHYEASAAASGLFGEAVVDLTDAKVVPAGDCFVAKTAWLKSRASTTFTTEMKDYIVGSPNLNTCGSIKIIKDAVPNDLQDFAYTTTGTGLSAFTLDDDSGVTGADSTYSNSKLFDTNISPGTYTVTETVPTGWDLTSISCNDGSSATPSTVSLADKKATINLDPNEDVECTFTNTKRGTIIVEKQTLPDGDATNFTFTGDAAGAIQDGQQITASNLVPGTYYSTETVPTGWDLTSISCNDGSSATPSTVSLADKKATFKLDPGETVKCTFTNTKRGTIIVEKQTVPDGASGSFTFTGDAAGTISDNGQITASNLAPGTYYSTETVPTGWDLTSVTCDDGSSATPSTVSLADKKATFKLDPGETVKCTFTNTLRYKFVVFTCDMAGTPVLGQATLTGGTPQATQDTDASTATGSIASQVCSTTSTGVFTNLAAGSYTPTITIPKPSTP